MICFSHLNFCHSLMSVLSYPCSLTVPKLFLCLVHLLDSSLAYKAEHISHFWISKYFLGESHHLVAPDGLWMVSVPFVPVLELWEKMHLISPFNFWFVELLDFIWAIICTYISHIHIDQIYIYIHTRFIHIFQMFSFSNNSSQFLVIGDAVYVITFWDWKIHFSCKKIV